MAVKNAVIGAGTRAVLRDVRRAVTNANTKSV